MEKVDKIEKLVSLENDFKSWLMITRVRHKMLNARQKELAPFRISPRQAFILFAMYNIGHKTTLAELARYSDREINTVSIQMTRLEKDGLVKKIRGEIPKSVLVMFELTKKGVDIYHKTSKIRSIREIMSVLSDDEIQQLISILEKIADKAENYQPA